MSLARKPAEFVELIKVYDRLFTVVAKFTGLNYVDEANAYMTEHRDTGLIVERDGTAYIARLKDKGTPA